MPAGLSASSRENLSSRVYGQLREALMAGRFWPGQRLRIRELATAMDVSDTPVREAIMQLVREGGLEMRSGQAITVVKLSLARYQELREVRILLEGLATEKATPLITPTEIDTLELRHQQLVAAEHNADYETAVLANFQFHFGIYRASGMTDLVTILESVWLRNGPLLKYLYPHAAPTYPGKHQHLNLIKALRLGDADAARQAIQHDMVEGGARLIELLAMIEDGRAVVAETAQGGMQLEFHAPTAQQPVSRTKR